MTIKQIQDRIEAGLSLKSLTESYTEIASLKLRAIRDDVQQNATFFEELAKVYNLVKQIAAKEQLKVNFKTKDTLSIIITSNYRFYGNINTRLAEVYVKQTATYKTDMLVIGLTGQQFLKPLLHSSNLQFLIFKKDTPNELELQQLGQFIQPYNRVLVYYSQFKSVLVQLPVIKDITQSQISGVAAATSELARVSDTLGFILEPEIAEMLVFFDSQMGALLLQEAFLEAELSRTAARLISMDEAQDNAGKYIKVEKNMLNIQKKSIVNMRILETINAFAKISRESKLKGGKI